MSRKGSQRSNRSDSVEEQLVTLPMLTAALNELRTNIKADFSDEISKLRDELMELRTENKILKDVVVSQQKQILLNERTSRDKNLIVLGVPDDQSTNHESFVNKLLKHVASPQPGSDRQIECMSRLGKYVPGKCRPVKVVLTTSKYKYEVLRKASASLKGSDSFNKVFIKPDLCEIDRLERKRLFDHFKQQKSDPNNAGKSVTLIKGVLKIDTNEIDRSDPCSNIFRP